MFNKKSKEYLENLEYFFSEVKKIGFSISENKRNDGILYSLVKVIFDIKVQLVIRNQTLKLTDDHLNYVLVFERIDSPPNEIFKHSLVYLRDDLLNTSGFEYIDCSNEFQDNFLKNYNSFLINNALKIDLNSSRIDKLLFLEDYIYFYIQKPRVEV